MSGDILDVGRPDMTPGIDTGLLKEVTETEGTGLVGDHAAGATVLDVAAGAFRTTGQCLIEGTTYAYVRDEDTLTITPALVADAPDGTPVESLTPDGKRETALVAVVDVDMTGDPDSYVRAAIPGELVGYYPLGTTAAGSIVRVDDTPYGYVIAGRPLDAPAMDASTLDPATFGSAGIAHQSSVDAIEDDIAAINGQIVDMPRTVYAPSRPVVEAGETVVWYDSDDGYAAERWDGAAWTPVKWGEAALADGSVLGRHFTGLTFQGVAITGALVQTTATANRGIKITSSGLVGYDTAGVARTVINPTTGLISAQGTMQAIAGDSYVRMSARGNPFFSLQNAGMLDFGVGGSWEPATVHARADFMQPAKLRLTAPYPTAEGPTVPAILELSTWSGGGGTAATLQAETVNFDANTWNVGSPDGTSVDFNLDVNNMQFIGTSGRRITLNFGTSGTGILRSGTGGSLEKLSVQGSSIDLVTTGARTLNLGNSIFSSSNPILADSNVGIMFGGGNASIHIMDETGFDYRPVRASSFPVSSDAAYKVDIVPLTGGLATVRDLDPATWTWAEGVDRGGTPGVGFVAQQVREHLPCAVSGDDGSLGVDVYPLVGTLWAAVQELDRKITTLEQGDTSVRNPRR